MKRMKRMTALALILCLLCSMAPTQALAWKTRTHNYSARLLVDELVGEYKDGAYFAKYADLLAGGALCSLPVEEEFARAILRYPQAFYAGSQGPDAYPDLYVGQTMIHPYDAKKDVGSHSWLEALVDAVNTMPKGDARDEAMAFVLGVMLHYCGDLFGHDFVNSYALGSFPQISTDLTLEDAKVVARHLAVETEMDARIPAKYSDNAVHAPTDFLLGSLVYDGVADKGAAPIYGNSLPFHYKFLLNLRGALHSMTQNLRSNPDPASAMAVKYADRWIEDVDRGIRGWIDTSDAVAQRLLINTDPSVTDVDIFAQEIRRWFTQWGRYMTPVPDVVFKALDVKKDVISFLTKPLEKFIKPLKSQYDNFVGMILGGLKNTLYSALEKRLGHHFTDLIKRPGRVLFSDEELAGYESDMLLFERNAQSSGNSAVGQELAAFYNTLMMMKLVLMGPTAYGEAFFDGQGAGGYVMEKGCAATADSLEVVIRTADEKWAGTDNNVYLLTWGVDDHGNTYGQKETLLDISGHNDFERGKTDTYRVTLAQGTPLDELRVAIRKDKSPVSDDWKLDWVEIMPCHGATRMLEERETHYSKVNQWFKGNHRLELGKAFSHVPDDDPRLYYDSPLSDSALSFVRSLDESEQWREETPFALWSDVTLRQQEFFRLFKGFEPDAGFAFHADGEEAQAHDASGEDLVTVTQGEAFSFYAARLENRWNGVPASRRAKWQDKTVLKSGAYYKPVGGEVTFKLYGEIKAQQPCAVENTDQMVQKTSDALWDMSGLSAGLYRVTAVYSGDANNAPFTRDIAQLRVLPAPQEQKYAVYAADAAIEEKNGADTGEFEKGETVTVAANEKTGYVFDHWESDDISDWDEEDWPETPTVSFTMPDHEVTVIAMYRRPAEHCVTVVGGTGGGFYVPGEIVQIATRGSSETPYFDSWTGDDTALLGETRRSMTAQFVMPDRDVQLTAGWKNTTKSPDLLVSGGVITKVGDDALDPTPSDRTMAANDRVTVKAVVPENMRFVSWVLADDQLALLYEDEESGESLPEQLFMEEISFTMPNQDVFLFAEFDTVEEEKPGEWTVVVIGGRGAGSYRPGETVTIEAFAPMDGELFDGWTCLAPDGTLVLEDAALRESRVRFSMPELPKKPDATGNAHDGDIESEADYEDFMTWLEGQIDDDVILFIARHKPVPLSSAFDYPDMPPTGDGASPAGWAALLAAALALEMARLARRRRAKR